MNNKNVSAKQSKPYRIDHSNAFWTAYYDYSQGAGDKSFKNIEFLKNFITAKRFSIKSTRATYRTINHWSEIGVIDDDRVSNGNGWRKFSIVDLVWLEVVAQLKNFGFSLKKIKFGYNSLTPSKHILEFAVALALLRKHSYLVAFKDGYFEIATITDVIESVTMGLIKDTAYVMVNINNCLTKFFPHLSVLPSGDIFELNTKEFYLLASIRLKDWDEINIKKKNGEIEKINIKKNHLSDIPKITDLLDKLAFGECKIKKQNGKIVFIEEIEKNKV